MSSSQHTSPLQQTFPASNAELVDLMADVSHHGSSLFDSFSLPAQHAKSPSANVNQSNPKSSNNMLSFDFDLASSSPSPVPQLTQHQIVQSVLPPSYSAPKTPRRNPRQPASSRVTKPPKRRNPRTPDPKSSTPSVSHADSDDGSDASDEHALNNSINNVNNNNRNNNNNNNNNSNINTHHRNNNNSNGNLNHSLTGNALTPTSGKPPTSAAKHTPNGDSSVARLDPPVKQAHNSHTRRCRAKVNSKFQELMQILPEPSSGIKHKAQILEYAIQIFRDYKAKKMSLEVELALSSRTHLNSWVDDVVSHSLSLQDLLGPYLSLICTKGNWKYSEAWVSSQDTENGASGADSCGMTGTSGHSRMLTPANSAIGPNSRLRLGQAVIPSLASADDPDLQTKLEHFRDKSRPYGCKARVDLPGRVLCTMRPEWLPSLEDPDVFQRARLANDASLAMCFGVPVFIRGYVAAVAMFFDTEKRPYDAKCVDLADYVASLLGRSFGTAGRRPHR